MSVVNINREPNDGIVQVSILYFVGNNPIVKNYMNTNAPIPLPKIKLAVVIWIEL